MSQQSLAFWNSQLENAKTVPDADEWPERYAKLSEGADKYGKPERIATGEDDMQAVWRVATGRPSHAIIFIHGGYWRRFAAADFAFAAAAAAAADATFYNVDYRLMPGARLSDVVADTVAGVTRAMEEVDRAVLCGHSAGGHLTAEAALRTPNAPFAAVPISGIFELDPLRFAFIQDEIALTAEEVAQYSPQDRAGELSCPVHVIAGGDETVEFRRQSARFHDAIADGGGTATLDFYPGTNHFSVVAELASENSALSQRIAAILNETA